jgi:hypothetical protein
MKVLIEALVSVALVLAWLALAMQVDTKAREAREASSPPAPLADQNAWRMPNSKPVESSPATRVGEDATANLAAPSLLTRATVL